MPKRPDMTLRLVIADDHAMVLDGLRAALAQCDVMRIVPTANNGIQAIAAIKANRPDIALLDLSMPGANGVEVIAEAQRWSPETRFIVMTGTPSPALLARLSTTGISGLFLKSVNIETLRQGILDVAVGRKVIAPDVQKVLDQAPSPIQLSPREYEVLQAIARGLSNAQMAETLGISPKTVDSHRTNLMQKMEVRSTATLLVKAMREGLIDAGQAPE